MKDRVFRILATIGIIAAVVSALSACPAEPRGDGRYSIVSYNLMNLFDPVDQGGEYAQFSVANGEWDERSYRSRVDALAKAVRAMAEGGPDVLVVQEAENRRVLEDLAYALGGYGDIVRSPDEDAVVACGVLTRLPVVSARSHRASPPRGPTGAETGSAPRNLLEVELDAGGHRLVILAAHWKSKLGGARETEPERRAAAALARSIVKARLSADPGLAIVLAGDLNENPDEFARSGGSYLTALALSPGSGDDSALAADRLAISFDAGSAACGPGLVLYSPWGDGGGYSYRYRGDTERIDNFLLSPGLVSPTGAGLRLAAFSAKPPSFIVDAEGTPIAWSRADRDGFSDHLPIMAVLEAAP